MREAAVAASLGLCSFATFYRFARTYFQERLFPYHSFAPSSARRSCSAGSDANAGTLSLAGARRAFSSTFALSCCIFELIVLEVAGLLNPASSAPAWRVCLILMVFLLHVVLPFTLAYAVLGEMHLGRRASAAGGAIFLSLVLYFASNLGRNGSGGVTGLESDINETGGRRVNVFSLEAGLARIGIAGIASLAFLSGFGAVHLPYQQLATLLRRVPDSVIESREKRAVLTLADIGQRKRMAALRRAENPEPASVRGFGGARVRHRAFGRRIASSLMHVIAPASASAHSEAETANLERVARALFLEIADYHRIQQQHHRARTASGRVVIFFGAIMFVYCLLRLWKAGLTVLWVPYVSAAGGVLSAGERGATVDDPATRLARFALGQHMLIDADAAEGWSELISFLLIGVLVLLQTRGFLSTIAQVCRSSVLSGISVPPQVLSVLLSMMMGAYFTSNVILMHVNLPPRHRVSITAVLGGMTFSFYERWFDTVFLLSGCATASTLFVLHIANRNSDADHSDGDYALNYSRSMNVFTPSEPGLNTSEIRNELRPRGRGGAATSSAWQGVAHHTSVEKVGAWGTSDVRSSSIKQS